jgi:hypothetical protein
VVLVEICKQITANTSGYARSTNDATRLKWGNCWSCTNSTYSSGESTCKITTKLAGAGLGGLSGNFGGAGLGGIGGSLGGAGLGGLGGNLGGAYKPMKRPSIFSSFCFNLILIMESIFITNLTEPIELCCYIGKKWIRNLFICNKYYTKQ